MYERYETGRESLSAILSFLKERIELEEKYAKRIEALVTSKSTNISEKGYVVETEQCRV